MKAGKVSGYSAEYPKKKGLRFTRLGNAIRSLFHRRPKPYVVGKYLYEDPVLQGDPPVEAPKDDKE